MRKPKIDIAWTEAEFAAIKEHYTKPDGIKIIQSMFPHRSYNSIKGMANVKFSLRRKPSYSKNDDFFKNPVENTHVIAGFIAADGCVSEERGTLTIGLAIKDEDYLDKIRLALGFDGPLYYGQTKTKEIFVKNKWYTIEPKDWCRLLVTGSDRWIEDLDTHWNITPRKTYTLQPPNLTNLRHILCYLSGLIDGDGWVCINNKPDALHGKVLEISVMGTEPLMHWVKRVFDYITPGQTDAIVKKTGKYSWAITLRGMRAYVIAKVFLSLDILRLDRKWDLARDYIALLDQPGGMSLKMTTYLRKTGYDPTLINRLAAEEILLPIV